MLKKLLLAAAALYGVWAVSVHMNDKLMRGYFMAPLKFKDLVAEDNMSEREGSFGFKSKIWLYGVNSPEKLAENFNKYDGFEIDVVYNEKERTFFVGRGSGKVTLDDMFAVKPDLSGKFFWLDVKNIDFNNQSEILRELIALTGRNIMHKSHLVVVSPNAEYLDDFAASGFLTCFRFPSLYRVKRGDIRKVLEAAVEIQRSTLFAATCAILTLWTFIFREPRKCIRIRAGKRKTLIPIFLSVRIPVSF